MPYITDEIRRCLVCGNGIPLEEGCYQIRYGALSEVDDDFIVDHEEGYIHEQCLPLTPAM